MHPHRDSNPGVRQKIIYNTKFQYRHSSKPGKRGVTKNVIARLQKVYPHFSVMSDGLV